MMPYLIGLDIGTSGAKALVCDQSGQVLATALAEYPIYSPRPQWSEQHPSDWWSGAQTALQTVMTAVGEAANEIVGMGLTGQMHGAVFLDAQDQVIRPALLWNDQRTQAQCDAITERVGASRLIELAGNPALTGFQAPKILWLHDEEPAHYQRLSHVLLPKDYIRLLLTGEYATDASDAAGTLLLDLRARDWSDEILQKLDISRDWLPRVYEGPEVTGTLLPDVAAKLGLPLGLPVIAGGGDNAAAAVGTGIIRPGVVSSSIGTSGVLFAHSDDLAFDPHGRLHTFCHAVPGKYHLMGVTLSAGGSFRWLRDTICDPEKAISRLLDVDPYELMTREAERVPVGAEGLLFLPYLTGERSPHLDSQARGAFVGLTARHTRPHMVRAVMEGVAFSLRDSLEIMRELHVPLDDIRATGGGGKSPLWRDIQKNVYNVPVKTLNAEEGPAYGAALLAGVGAGVFADVEAAVDSVVQIVDSNEPSSEQVALYDQYYAIYRALYGALRDSMHALWRVI